MKIKDSDITDSSWVRAMVTALKMQGNSISEHWSPKRGTGAPRTGAYYIYDVIKGPKSIFCSGPHKTSQQPWLLHNQIVPCSPGTCKLPNSLLQCDLVPLMQWSKSKFCSKFKFCPSFSRYLHVAKLIIAIICIWYIFYIWKVKWQRILKLLDWDIKIIQGTYHQASRKVCSLQLTNQLHYI